MTAPESVAIVGMSGRFPGAPDVEKFWSNIRDGVESIVWFSASEVAASGVSPEVAALPNYVSASGPLDDIELFDAGFFGFNPREAESLDPQHRLFLEEAWHALEDAACDPSTYKGTIGVYAGCGLST